MSPLINKILAERYVSRKVLLAKLCKSSLRLAANRIFIHTSVTSDTEDDKMPTEIYMRCLIITDKRCCGVRMISSIARQRTADTLHTSERITKVVLTTKNALMIVDNPSSARATCTIFWNGDPIELMSNYHAASLR